MKTNAQELYPTCNWYLQMGGMSINEFLTFRKLEGNLPFARVWKLIKHFRLAAVRRKCWTSDKCVALVSRVNVKGFYGLLPCLRCCVPAMHSDGLISHLYKASKEDKESSDWELYTLHGKSIEELEKVERGMHKTDKEPWNR